MQTGKWLVLGSLLTLCGCASGPEPTHVQQYGDKYFVNYQSMFGAGTALEASIKDANAFCEAKGLHMAPISSDRGELFFRCVPENELSQVSAPPKR